MTAVGKALADLTACLRGELPTKTDWLSIFEISNRTLLTPALFEALSRAGQIDKVPEDACTYLEFIHQRNLERNKRLRAQLIEALAALNRAGIEPTLLKGAVPLFSAPENQIGGRLTRDLDLSVGEHEAKASRQCLIDLGYEDDVETRGMGRPQDVGTLELRQRPRASSAAYLRSEYDKPSSIVERDGVRARIPSPTSRALHWIVHDLIKEGDYWRGRLDLRHLYDLAELVRAGEQIDWIYLKDIMPDQFGRNVIETQALALHRLFGIDIPASIGQRNIVRFQHWRRLFTAMHPTAGAPLSLLGNLSWGMRQAIKIDRLGRRGRADLARRVQRTIIGTRAGAKL
ncbi:nucleotidyltransferase family protein [Microvirga sp. G4-2]|uniref:nucleotidyltransferase family protein n=1 Tax=Microvirga sp. G4-2 TaxID=3434467 RepID=UPI004043CF34